MQILRYIKALADPTRLRLFNILSHHEFHVNEMVRLLQMGQSRISRHLKILTDNGLLVSRRDGLLVYYTAAEAEETEQLASVIRASLRAEAQTKEDLRRSADIVHERSRTTRQFFNTIAENWDSLKKDILGGFHLYEMIAEHIQPCGTAVDVGCGTGDLLSLLVDKTHQVIGIDSSPGMLDQARRRFTRIQKIDLRLGEVEHLPIRDQTVDAAVMNMVLHHLSQPEQGIREIYRILKPRSLFVITEFAKHDRESVRVQYGDRWLGFTEDTVHQWLETWHFNVEERKEYQLEQRLKLIMYIARKQQ